MDNVHSEEDKFRNLVTEFHRHRGHNEENARWKEVWKRICKILPCPISISKAEAKEIVVSALLQNHNDHRLIPRLQRANERAKHPENNSASRTTRGVSNDEASCSKRWEEFREKYDLPKGAKAAAVGIIRTHKLFMT